MTEESLKRTSLFLQNIENVHVKNRDNRITFCGCFFTEEGSSKADIFVSRETRGELSLRVSVQAFFRVGGHGTTDVYLFRDILFVFFLRSVFTYKKRPSCGGFHLRNGQFHLGANWSSAHVELCERRN